MSEPKISIEGEMKMQLTHKGYRITLAEEFGRLGIWLKEPTDSPALVLDVSLLYGEQYFAARESQWDDGTAVFDPACTLIDSVPLEVLEKIAIGQQELCAKLKEIMGTNTDILEGAQDNSSHIRELYLR